MLSLLSKVKKSVFIQVSDPSVAQKTTITSGGVPVAAPTESGFVDIFAYRELTVSLDESAPPDAYVDIKFGGDIVQLLPGESTGAFYPLTVSYMQIIR